MWEMLRKGGSFPDPDDDKMDTLLGRTRDNDGECPCPNGLEDRQCPCTWYREEGICRCGLYLERDA